MDHLYPGTLLPTNGPGYKVPPQTEVSAYQQRTSTSFHISLVWVVDFHQSLYGGLFIDHLKSMGIWCHWCSCRGPWPSLNHCKLWLINAPSSKVTPGKLLKSYPCSWTWDLESESHFSISHGFAKASLLSEFLPSFITCPAVSPSPWRNLCSGLLQRHNAFAEFYAESSSHRRHGGITHTLVFMLLWQKKSRGVGDAM